MIHQHFKLVDVLTATENIVLGLKEPGGLDLKAATAKRCGTSARPMASRLIPTRRYTT
jgi:ABC-type uncharacterized transport system ATPase subunit